MEGKISIKGDNQDPRNVEYWEEAKRFIDVDESLAASYAELCKVSLSAFLAMTPREWWTAYGN